MVDGIQELIDVLKVDAVDSTRTYSAEISSIDNEGTVWVYLSGSTMETPTALSAAEVSIGDAVNVEWRNNKLYIAGNVSNPSAGAVRVGAVERAAQVANQAAQNAVADASTARQAAEAVRGIAVEARASADDAQESAGRAMESADNAKQSADTAFKQLSVVEDIVGVLDLIAKNGDYRPTQDTEAIADKWYFTRSGTDPDYVYSIATIETFYRKTEDTEIEEGKTYYTRSGTDPDYVYTPVENPVVEDIGTYYEAYKDPRQQGLYELFGIDQSIQNYVSSHLVLLGNTLSLRTDGSDYRLDLTTTGMQVIGANGLPIATYGTETIVGREDDFHIKMDGNELGFYRGAYKIAYMSGGKLYIPQSVVLQQMDVGLPYGHIDPTTQQQDGFGQWSWKLHLNNENPPRNNLNLKWIG